MKLPLHSSLLLALLCLPGCLGQNEGNCSYWYYLTPPVVIDWCNPRGADVILSCGVYVSRELPVEVRWYWTQDDQSAGISGIWINENSTGHTLQYSTLLQFDSGEFTGLHVDLHSLTILDFNESNSGYYWCQFLLNGTQLDPSRSGYVTVNDSYSQVCLTNDIRFLSTGTLPAPLCAVRLDPQCCTSSLNILTSAILTSAKLSTSSTVSHTVSTSNLDTVHPSAGSIPLTLTASSSTSLYSSVIPSPLLSPEHNETGRSDIPIYIGVGIGSVLAVSLCCVVVLGFILLEWPRRKMRSAAQVAVSEDDKEALQDHTDIELRLKNT